MTQRQEDYYADTASDYESMHVQPGGEHFVALEYVAALVGIVRARSVLDIGSGTGRAIRFLRERFPSLRLEGIEPVAELREKAQALGVVLHPGSGQALPFDDCSFDVVMSFGVLHHVPDPAAVVAEMMRVARFGVMISDSNRFGQGSAATGILKLAIHQARLWPAFERLRTKGRGYMESAGDGVFYSYSIFDSMPQLQSFGGRVFVIPTGPQGRSCVMQIASPHGLLVALREPSDEGWAGR
jgi:ubiquinone/menaquinone biosynthesis C-methylase UbiE